VDILFKTIHGSRLYGMSHEGSDYDYYTVVDKVKSARAKYSRQTIIDDQDSVVVDFGTWVDQCKVGVPQALEAMFSQMAVEDKLTEFRTSFYAGTTTHERYLRTITSFVYATKDVYKRKRHALRLAYNFVDLKRYGRFNPTLAKDRFESISLKAYQDQDSVYAFAMALAQNG
jgi:predicted nucleotidyltransferase